MKTNAKLLIVDLAQSILIFIGVAAFYFITTGKSVNPPASKIVPVIPQEKLEELQEVILEFEDEVSDVCNSFLDGITEFWREILVGSAVLFMLLVLGLFSYFFLSWLLAESRISRMLDHEEKETHITTRHLLDLSEAERWRYIEAKHKGDLEEQMKILRGCGCKDDADAELGVAIGSLSIQCSECSDGDCKCQEVKNEMEMI